MAISATRKRQFLLFTIVVYGLTFYAVYHATRTSISFLQTVIKLTEGFNVIILAVFTILNSALLWKLSTLALFGDLRLIEYEHIFERLPFTIINTVFMSSMFNEHDFFTVALFGLLLLYMKVFHWILKDRLEALLQTIQDSTRIANLILTRFSLNLILLAVADYQIVSHCVSNSLSNSFGASTSVHLMIGMEFTMLLIDLLNVFLHASLSFYELYRSQASDVLNNENIVNGDEEDDDSQFTGLEGKFMYERIIDIITRFLKTVIHTLMLIPFRMPIMLIKDVLWDFLTLYQNVTSLWKIWRNNKQLDDKLPTVTHEELQQTDNICIVCMDELLPESETQHRHNSIDAKYKPKRLPCGHVLHLYCLKNWMERSQTCPICRLAVFDETGNVVQSNASTNSRPASAATATATATSNPVEDSSTTAAPPVDAIPQPNAMSSTHEEQLQEQQQTPQQQQQQPNINSWYSFPIEESNDNSIAFKLLDSRTNKPISAKILIDKKETITDDSPNESHDRTDDQQEVKQKIIISDELINSTQTIEGLKRRVSELESQVQELNKRLRRD